MAATSGVVDAHVHMGPGLANWTERPVVRAETADQLIAALDASGVARACTFAPSWEGGAFDDPEYQQANRAVHEARKRYPDRIIGICRINPNLGKAALDEMQRCREDYGFRGLKLHQDWEFFSINNPMLRPFLERAQEYNWPVFLHTGYYPLSQPALALPVAQEYPGVNFVLFHLSFRFTTDAIVIAERCPNVFLETSSNSSASAIVQVIEQLGASKLIYGSDLPTARPDEVIAKIRQLPGISEPALRRILGVNVLELLGERNQG